MRATRCKKVAGAGASAGADEGMGVGAGADEGMGVGVGADGGHARRI